jgi:RNA polymerase sigma-70 factor (ECF subfamily)
MALLVAVNEGDVDRVVSLLAEDVVLVSDGGEHAHAARLPVHGPDRVARLWVNLARRYRHLRIELATINREPGFVAFDGDQAFLTLSVEIADGAVRAVHAVVSPDKLAALDLTTPIV